MALLVPYLVPGTASTLDIPLAEQKLSILENNVTQYNVVFLGTSRMYRGIDPDIVDAEANTLGCHIKSYNLGIPGLSTLEQDYLIDRLEQLQTGINTIIIEPYSVPDRTLGQFISEQRRYFYDWEHMADVFRDHFSMPNVSGMKVIGRDTLYLIYGFLYEQAGVGRLSKLFFPTPEQTDHSHEFKPSSGFQSTDEVHDESMTKRREIFLKHIGSFENKIKKSGHNTPTRSIIHSRYDMTAPVISHINNIKKKPVVLMMPQIAFSNNAKVLEQQLLSMPDKQFTVINLNKPAQYTDLFTSDNWFDEAHLNKQGSIVLSKIVARRLCATQGQEQ